MNLSVDSMMGFVKGKDSSIASQEVVHKGMSEFFRPFCLELDLFVVAKKVGGHLNGYLQYDEWMDETE